MNCEHIINPKNIDDRSAFESTAVSASSILAHAPDAIVATDLDSRVLFLNAAAEAMYGINAQQAIGRPLAEIYSVRPQGGKSPETDRRAALTSGAWRGESEHVLRDGTVKAVEEAVACARDGEGNVIALVGAIRDVSRQSRAAAAEMQLSALLGSGIIGVARVRESGWFDVNQYVSHVLGYTREELIDGTIHWSQLVVEEERADALARLEELRTTGRCLPYHRRYVRKDGSIATLFMGAASYRPDPLEWVCFIQDLSEQSHIHEALRCSEERYRTVVEALAEGIVVTDANGRVLQANAAAAHILGGDLATDPFGNPSYKGKLIREDGSVLSDMESPAALAFETGEFQDHRIVGLRRTEDSVIWLQVNSRPVRDPRSGCVREVISSLFDITRHKQAEAVLRERAEREELLNRIAKATRSTFDPEAIQREVAILVGRSLGLDRCYYVRYDPTANAMIIAPGYHREPLPPLLGVRSLSEFSQARRQLFASGTAVIPNIPESSLSAEVKAVQLMFRHQAIIAVPFFDRGAPSAALIGAMTKPRDWTPNEVDIMERAATMTRTAVEAAFRVSRDMTIARTLQDALIPPVPAEVAGLRLASFYRAALDEARVGGDFADAFAPTRETAYMVIGDVSGKGLAAASQVAMVRNMLRFSLLSEQTLERAFSKLNDILAGYGQLSGFVTLLGVCYDAREQAISYVNCGHEGGLILRASTGQTESLTPTGTVLGAIEGAPFGVRTTSFEPGDGLVIFTDGFTEAGRSASNLLTAQGMTAIVEAQHPANDPATLISGIMSAVDLHADGSVRDDQCIVAALA